MRRREFIAGMATAAGAAADPSAVDVERRICVFTDFVDDFLDVSETARVLRELDVNGVDLTVRRGGLVQPERVAEDLPRAIAVCREQGVAVPMISTEVTSANDPQSVLLLKTAAAAGVRYYKTGYRHYADVVEWRKTINEARSDLEALAQLNEKLGIRGGFHQHAGSVGGALWDAWEVLAGFEPRWMGLYYDVAHATIEGGNLGWKLGLLRSAAKIVIVGIKDLVWERSPKGWRTRWVPLGEGMVDWLELFRLMRRINFHGPISLHLEYNVGGSTKAERYDNSRKALSRDLAFLRQKIREAYS